MNPNKASKSNQSTLTTTSATKASKNSNKFDQPVILRQSNVWSRAILWTIIGFTSFGIIWACVAKIDQAIPAQGKLEPEGAVKEVKAPVNGVVQEILVRDGQRVQQGDPLIRLDTTVAKEQLSSLSKIRETLIKENQFLSSTFNNSTIEPDSVQLQLPEAIVALTKNRRTLIAENLLYRSQLSGDLQAANLSPEQRNRLQIIAAELKSRVSSNELEVGQLQKQLEQNKVQLANAKSRLAIEQEIADKLSLLNKNGAFPSIQVSKQQQEAKTRKAEVDQLVQEQERLLLKIGQAQEQLKNTVALSQKDLLTQISTNEKQIAEIDSQLNKIIVDNGKKITEIDAQLSQANQNLNYQEIKAPVGGTVFDLKPAAAGFVINTTEPLLKIVPDDSLVAKIYLTNKDIGFVKIGMPVDVRIDSFPYSEFGDLKGKLEWIGSDALPPEQIRPFYSFPAKVKLDKQSLVINGRPALLKSGMSLSTNIRVRKRTVISIFTDLFTEKTESLKNVR
ncbi:MAG: HlyD family efflux transporter periplasmic adaptor subunit [Coleofasciculaceae cyanobacterium]